LSLLPQNVQDEDLTPREKQLIDNLVTLAAYAERQRILLTRLAEYGNAANTEAIVTTRHAYWVDGSYAEKVWKLRNAP
jgi:hypothetical protein